MARRLSGAAEALITVVLLTIVALLAAPVASLGGSAPPFTMPPNLPTEEAQRVRTVAEAASVRGRVNGQSFVLNAEIFEYLVDHPEFASEVMRSLGYGRYRAWREPEGLWADDGGGAIGRMWVVHAAPHQRVFYIDGNYKPPILPAIKGRIVVVLDYPSEPAADGKRLITPTLTAYLKIDNIVVEAASRILNAVATEKAERLAKRLVRDVAKTARAIDQEPSRVRDELSKRPSVAPGDLERFGRLLSAR
jgi:hypothetical protein